MGLSAPGFLSDVFEKHRLWIESKGKDGYQADLRGADLSRLNLQGINLAHAVLSNAVLAGAILRSADLSGSEA